MKQGAILCLTSSDKSIAHWISCFATINKSIMNYYSEWFTFLL